jgi:hypothetical protein
VIPEKMFVIIRVRASLEECLERIHSKDFSKTPFPATSDPIEESIIRMDARFGKGFDVMWAGKAIDIIDYFGNDSKLI